MWYIVYSKSQIKETKIGHESRGFKSLFYNYRIVYVKSSEGPVGIYWI